jgi:hypothetical protein
MVIGISLVWPQKWVALVRELIIAEHLRMNAGRSNASACTSTQASAGSSLAKIDVTANRGVTIKGHQNGRPRQAKPLTTEHVPTGDVTSPAVALVSIFHHEGVNALAADQTLKFAPAPGLTIVYGDNGAGKTGYIRILKQACRARGRELILGNVYRKPCHPAPS